MPRLSEIEIDAVLSVAGNALPAETFADDPEIDVDAMVAAYERGMEKLRSMYAARRQQKARPPR